VLCVWLKLIKQHDPKEPPSSGFFLFQRDRSQAPAANEKTPDIAVLAGDPSSVLETTSWICGIRLLPSQVSKVDQLA
jgi:hypothetical protein